MIGQRPLISASTHSGCSSGTARDRHDYPGFDHRPPTWLGRNRVKLLLSVIGGPRQNGRKLRNVAHVATALLGRSGLAQRRLERLLQQRHIAVIPTTAQLWIAARDQVFLKAAVDSKELYRRKGIPWTFHNVRRFIAEPTTMMDPIGIYSSADTVANHILQTVHHNPLYDLELLNARSDGLDELERQLDELDAGTHVHQEALESLVEERDYWTKLRGILGQFRAYPTAASYPELDDEYPQKMALAIDQFKDLRGYTNYAARLDVDMGDVAVALAQVLFNYSVGMLAGITLGPSCYRIDCCDPELVIKHGLSSQPPMRSRTR